MKIDKDEILKTLDYTAFYKSHVPSLKETGKGQTLGLCPFHDDHNPSLSVDLKEGLYNCFSCGAKGDVFKFYQDLKKVDFKTALKEIAAIQGITETQVKQKIVATYEYKDADCKTLYIKERLEPGRNGRNKEFRFKHREGDKWVSGRGSEPVLYNLPELINSKYAVIVEGEGKVELLKKWGLATTCLDSGAGSPWKDEDTKALSGKEKIVILSDNDNPGRSYASKIANALHGKVGSLKVVELPGLEEAEDIIDWSRIQGNDKAKLLEIIKGAPEWTPKADIEASESEEEPELWEAPLLFGEIETPEIPANLLPGYLGEYCKAVSDSTQTPQGLAVMMGLSTVAACLQKRIEVSPFGDDYKEPVSLWTVTALPPATRKTAVKKAITEPLTVWEDEQATILRPEIKKIQTKRDVLLKRIETIKAQAAKTQITGDREKALIEIEGIENDMPEEKRPPRLWADDATPEKLQMLLVEHGERMALLSDEGGIFEIMSGLYSDGRVNLNVFLQSHAGSPVRVDRATRTAYLHRPALTFGLTIQPDILSEFSKGSKRIFRGTGTLARFLYCIPKSNIGSRDMSKRVTLPESIKTRYQAGILNLLSIPPVYDENGREKAMILTLHRAALDSWEKFSQWIEGKQGQDGEFEYIQDWTGKLPGAALRIAGLFQVIKYGTDRPTIDHETIEQSLDLCELLIPHTKAAFDLMGGDQAINDAKHVYRWILAKGEGSFIKSHCHKALEGRFRKVDRLDKALQVLTERHIISEPLKRATGKRPGISYLVNPAILKGGA